MAKRIFRNLAATPEFLKEMGSVRISKSIYGSVSKLNRAYLLSEKLGMRVRKSKRTLESILSKIS